MKFLAAAALILLTKSAQGRTSRRAKSSKGTKALSACLDTYPDYSGDINASGSTVTVKFDGDNLNFKYNLRGVEANCVDCGIHIHTGTTCDDASLVGGHYWDASKVDDLWTTEGGAVYNSDAGGNVKDHFDLTNGYDGVGNDGHAVVIHASDGSRVACGVLSKSRKSAKSCKSSKGTKALSTCLDTYPDYSGDINASGSTVTVKFDGDNLDFKYNLNGVEANCVDCGIHIHTGTTCDDASLVGGHYWDASKVDDLWTTEGGAVYNSDAGGNVKDHFDLTNGYDGVGNDGHAVVIHASDGSRVACGVLSKGRKSAKSCKTRKMTLETCLDTYPGYAGDLKDIAGKVNVSFKGTDQVFNYNMNNVDVNCEDCGIHIHTGTTCDDPALVGGHYFSDGTDDPWTNAGGSIYESDPVGKSKGHFHINAGLDYFANNGHAVVVHDKDGNRYGCGVLSSAKKPKGSCLG